MQHDLGPIVPLTAFLVTAVGPPFIDDRLTSLEKQVAELGAKVMVVACGTHDYADRIRNKFPWGHVLHQPSRRTVPESRLMGVQKAQGDIIAVTEEDRSRAQDWLREAARGHGLGDYGAVGGPVADSAFTRLRDWVVYFCEYNGYVPPAPDGLTDHLNGANIAYRRQTLLDHQDLLGARYWEASLHPPLLRENVRFLSLPESSFANAGIGGAIENGIDRPLNWAVYFCDFGMYQNPVLEWRALDDPQRQRLVQATGAGCDPARLARVVSSDDGESGVGFTR